MDRFLSTRFGASHSHVVGLIKGNLFGRLDPNAVDDLDAVLKFAAQLAKEGREQDAKNTEVRYFRHALLIISSTFKQLRDLAWPEGFDVDIIDFACKIDGAFLYAYTILTLDLWDHAEFKKEDRYVALQNPNPGRSAEIYSYMSRDIVNEYTMLLTAVQSKLDYKDIALRAARLALPYIDLGCLADAWTPRNDALLKGYEAEMRKVLQGRAQKMPDGVTRSVTDEELNLLEIMLHVKVEPPQIAARQETEEFTIKSWAERSRRNQSEKWLKCCDLFRNLKTLREYGEKRRKRRILVGDPPREAPLGGEDGVGSDLQEEAVNGRLAGMFWKRSKNIDDFFQTTLFQLTLFYETLAKSRKEHETSCFSKAICAIRNAREGNQSWILDGHLNSGVEFSALGFAMTDLLLAALTEAYNESNEYHGFDDIIERLVTLAVGKHSMSQSDEFRAFCSSCIARIGSFLLFENCFCPPTVALYILTSHVLKHLEPVCQENVDWTAVATLGQFDTLAKSYYKSKTENKQSVQGPALLFKKIMYQHNVK